VSCGFDSAIHDFLGWSNVTPQMYGYMTKKLSAICPKVLVLQEGGYNIEYLGQHASGVCHALLDPANVSHMSLTQADKDSGLTT
jgi:acetoin utilization deacetylase AcuC-like enzyme